MGELGIAIKIKSLSSLEDIERWARHCSECFSAKSSPPPAEYFLKHFHYDPWKDCTSIFVAYQNDEPDIILSTVRIFHRTSRGYLGSSVLTAGIGEVCTSINFRKLGLSRILLNHAIEFCMHSQFDRIILHAAEWIREFYFSVGFQSLPTIWSILTWSKSQYLKLQSFLSIRNYQTVNIDVENNADDLLKLNNQINSNFFGPIIRNKEYISTWINNETGGHIIGLRDNNVNMLIAYLIIRVYPSHVIQIRDFGMNMENTDIYDMLGIILVLINEYVKNLNNFEEVKQVNKLMIPQPLLQLALSKKERSNYFESVDDYSPIEYRVFQ